ncbi:MAG: hypothetical protein HYY00_06705 [Chloroflexi bacterium]|nr:hypothetical protein [Chloroflexota bacterium]
MHKGQSPSLVYQAPTEFPQVMNDLGVPVDTSPKGKYEWAIAFAKSLGEAEEIANIASSFLEDNAVFWVAYPKGTFKKYKADINRDTGNALMARYGLTGVSLVAIDDDWSAMRFKRTG